MPISGADPQVVVGIYGVWVTCLTTVLVSVLNRRTMRRRHHENLNRMVELATREDERDDLDAELRTIRRQLTAIRREVAEVRRLEESRQPSTRPGPRS